MTTVSLPTLLIIDDMPENVMVLLHFLTTQGFTVLVAQNGEEGIETAEYTHPDLILLDIMMPGLDGFEVCQQLKLKDNLKDIPIIFMTALADTVDKIKGFSLGAADYITKPIQQEEVLARIKTHLNLRQLQLQLQEQNQQLQEEIGFRKQVEEYLQNTANVLADRSVELRERTTELEKQRADLEKRNLELDVFAHTMAHDVKKPLNTILTHTELLLTDCSHQPSVNPSSIEKLQRVKQAGINLHSIIHALLILVDISRQTEPPTDLLDMADIVNQVIQQRLADLLTHSAADIQLPDSWPPAQGFAPWITEVWFNYLNNGLKYGGTPPRLELGAQTQNDGMIRFWVRDNGAGLTPEAQAKLFVPFTHLHHHHRTENEGFGLAIVRHIINKLNGDVGVTSTLGQGSLFYFTLPASNTSLTNKP